MEFPRSQIKVVCSSCSWVGKVKDLHERLVNINGENKYSYAAVKTPCCPRCKSTDIVYKDGIYLK